LYGLLDALFLDKRQVVISLQLNSESLDGNIAAVRISVLDDFYFEKLKNKY